MTFFGIDNHQSMELFDKSFIHFHKLGKNVDERGQNSTIPFDVSAQDSYGETAVVLTIE